VAVNGDHPNFASIREAAVAGVSAQDVIELADLSLAVGAKLTPLSERVKVGSGRVFFDGDPVDNSITRQILRCLEDAELDDWRPLVRFMENLAANPQEHSREQLYAWLDGRDFTITADGCFIGYKGVCKDDEGNFVSLHSGPGIVDGERHNGQLPNKVGSVIELERSKVAFDPAVGCSVGLHVGTYDYAQSYASGGMLKVSVNPRDVVSVPTDCDAQKVRTCRYRVLNVIDRPDTVPLSYDEGDEDDDWSYSDGEGI